MDMLASGSDLPCQSKSNVHWLQSASDIVDGFAADSVYIPLKGQGNLKSFIYNSIHWKQRKEENRKPI